MINMEDVISAVEKALKEKSRGLVQMPPKEYVFLKEFNGDFRVMPAYIPSSSAAGVKIVNVHVNNKEVGLPTVMATIFLLDPKTGEPISIMDGTSLTSMRTGAAGALAVKNMANQPIRQVAFIGAGKQAMHQLLAIKDLMKKFDAKAYDLSPTSTKIFSDFALANGVSVDVASDFKHCVEEADVIVATTPSTRPIIMADWVRPGTHINAIGADAPGKEELDPKILLKARVIVDDIEQASHSGEINVPVASGIFKVSAIAGELGDVLDGKIMGRTSKEEITVFDATGLAIEDIAAANLVLKKAKENNVGLDLKLMRTLSYMDVSSSSYSRTQQASS